MRHKLMMAAVLCTLGCFGAVEINPGAVDVVVAKKAPPAVRFAAQELTNFLAQALGAPVPIVGKPSERTAIVLGDNQWARAAGIDVDSRSRDTFFIKTAPNRVYLAGRDDPRKNPLSSPLHKGSLERATSFAVYAFLEDYAGVRFYFPGELGTIVPKKDRIVVPDVDRAVTPDFSVREWYNGKKAYWFGKTKNDAEGSRMKTLDWLRLRMGTQKIPLCHGTRNFMYLERFAETHPEYFSLKTNGSRTIDKADVHPGHLCWTSPIIEEMYQDVKAALTGKKPSDRGIPSKDWGSNVDLENGIVDIMPQDGQPKCACENCGKVYREGKSPVWLATKAIAERLTAEGVKGTITQMCYGRARKVPEYDLPTNILVQVAVRGQWSTGRPDLIANEGEQITGWMKKLGHKVWLWTYPGKNASVGPDFDGIPQLSMHAWGKYYSDFADCIIGGFSESETDRFSFNYLNYYVYSRVCWDVKTDIDAVLDEHYRLMFGAAAADMKELYTILETKWMTKLTGESKDTPLGPVSVVPSWKTIFSEIYPPSEVSRLDGIVSAALSKVGEGSLEARRIRLISDEFIGSIKAAAKAHMDRVSAVEGFRTRAGGEIPLRVFARRGRKPDIDRPLETKVKTWTDDRAIYATFVCEEPDMDKVAAKERPRDNGEIWADNSVEWYFCPTGDRCDCYHIGVNSEGAIFDNKSKMLGTRGSSVEQDWGDGVTATVEKGAKSWTCRMTVPFAAIGGRPVAAVPSLFARNRVVSGIRGSALYVWGPESITGFGNSENFGTVEYETEEKFDFLFSWAHVKDEAMAAAFAEIGVTDIIARRKQGFAAAKKHGMVPYCLYIPVGPHNQVLREDEQRQLDFLEAADLEGKASKEEIRRVHDERLIAAGFRHGGEPDGGPALCTKSIPCFLSDTNCDMAKAALDKILAENPDAEGIAFDYIGYMNMRSCECEGCRTRLAAFLAKEGLAENEGSRNRFFRDSLVAYINALVDYVHGVRPGFKVTLHLYPAFVPDPVYGGDLKADTVQETVAWYFQWPDAKIADYTRRVSAGEHQPGSARVPFVGLSATPGKPLASKTPERLEEELRIILAAGGRKLGVCNGVDMLKPGYREVFMKYCRRQGSERR